MPMMKFSLKNHLIKSNPHAIRWRSLLKTHALFFAIGFILHLLLDWLPIAFYNFKEIAIHDIDFSDLYYQSKEEQEYSLEDIVLVNSGSIQGATIAQKRAQMTQLLQIISGFAPKKIGLDIEYIASSNDSIDQKLEQVINKNKVVVAVSKQFKSLFANSCLGYVNFPGESNTTIRNYYNYGIIEHESAEKNFSDTIPSFASFFVDKPKNLRGQDQEYYLKYYCKDRGFYDLNRKNIEQETLFAFKAIEANQLLDKRVQLSNLKSVFEHKIVLIGHLGQGTMNNLEDITDKHKTPTDFEIISKSKIMPGLVIHANAIKQLQLDEHVVDLSSAYSGLYLWAILYVVSLYFFIVFFWIRNRFKIFFGLFLELTILVFSVLFLQYCSIILLKANFHLNSLYIAVMMIFLVELKSFFMEYYDEAIENEHLKH